MKIFKLVLNNQRGAVAVIVGITLAVLLSFLALAIDVGYLYATKNELQNAADAAALAAAGNLGNLYSFEADPTTYNCESDRVKIVNAAQSVVGSGKNKAGGSDISIRDADIFINNIADGNTKFSTNDYNQPDAVRVIARRDSVLNSQIGTFFAKIFGVDSVPVVADATAAMTGVSKMDAGDLPIPVGISKNRFTTEYCDKPIYFYPSNDDSACAGWHVYNDSDLKLKDILDGLNAGTFKSPEVDLNNEDQMKFYFKGGTVSTEFTDLKKLFDKYKTVNDAAKGDYDNDSDTWTTSVVVYQNLDGTDDCRNPNTWKTIIGFATITIYEICTASGKESEEFCANGEKSIVADVVCGYTKTVRGGGGTYGYKGEIVGLVE